MAVMRGQESAWRLRGLGKSRICANGSTLRGGLARFQSVETHPDFRCQGLASAVIGHAARWAPGVPTPVIVADPDDHAIRLYRTLGLAEAEHQIQLYRAPGS